MDWGTITDIPILFHENCIFFFLLSNFDEEPINKLVMNFSSFFFIWTGWGLCNRKLHQAHPHRWPWHHLFHSTTAEREGGGDSPWTVLRNCQSHQGLLLEIYMYWYQWSFLYMKVFLFLTMQRWKVLFLSLFYNSSLNMTNSAFLMNYD